MADLHCSARALRGPCKSKPTVEVVFSETDIRPYCLRHGAQWSGQRMWGMDKPVVIREAGKPKPTR
jgi:hypothetical protein